MAQKPRIKGIPKVTDYSALVGFANTTIAGLTGNLTYPIPDPNLASIQAAVLSLQSNIAAWGPVGARGTHLDLMHMRSNAFLLRNLLVQLEGYVLSTAIAAGGDYATQSAAITSSGFGLKNPPSPQGLLGVPQNFHQFFKNGISIHNTALRWKKPLGLTSASNVKNYQIYRGASNGFNDPTITCIGTSTRCFFIDKTLSNGPVWYFITASNDAGIGAPTAALAVNQIP
jgi:hypothetical protein